MRRRIVLSTVAVVTLVLLTFGLPLAVALRGLEVNRGLDGVEAQAQQAAVILSSQARTLGEAELILEVLADRSASRFTLFQGTTLALLDTGPGQVPAADGPTLAAATGQGGRAYIGGTLRAAAPLAGVGRAGLVLRAIHDDAQVRAAIRRSRLLLVGGALLVLGFAVAGAWFQAQRLSRPFERLAGSARLLGRGDFTARAPRSGLEEADAIGDALDATAERLGRALERGTAFAADASHQLRTPLTALRLHLESVAAGADPDVAVEAALAEADRLEATIGELVALTRPETSEERVDAASLLRSHLPAWTAQLASQRRPLTFETQPVPPVRVRTAAVLQAVQVLVDNAARHGVGAVALSVAPASGTTGVRICVRDEGPGVPDDVAGDGRGLALAQALIQAEGGSLVYDDGVPCLLLPVAA